LIATAVAPHHHKARWLSFWNSGTHTREALHFPAKGFKTEELESWLNKASFWAWVKLLSLTYTFGILFRSLVLELSSYQYIMPISVITRTCIFSFFLYPFFMNLQLEEGAVQMLTKTIEEDGLEICTEGIQKPRTIDEYVQAWRNQI
jgi:hypothetical protein